MSQRALHLGSVVLLAGMLIGPGILHFRSPEPFDAIIPSVIPEPAHRPLTYISGAVELLLGAGVAWPRTRRRSAQLAALFYIAVFPANVQGALDGGAGLPGPLGTPLGAWLRLPLQLPLIWFAWWVSRLPAADSHRPPGPGADPAG